MKLHKLTFGILAAVTAFILGISGYAAVGFAQSFLPTATADHNLAKIEPVPAVTEPAQPIFVGPSIDDESAVEDPNEEFDPAGSYYLDVEKVPNAFADIDHLMIETFDYTTVAPIAPKGWILTDKELRFDRISIGNKKLNFQTATINGVSYKFTGSFVTEAYCESDGDTPDLKGRLIKIKDNKWAAEMEAEFYMQCGC